MNTLLSLVVTLLLMALFSVVLFYVVRTAVKEGVEMALRADLLRQRSVGKQAAPRSDTPSTEANGL